MTEQDFINIVGSFVVNYDVVKVTPYGCFRLKYFLCNLSSISASSWLRRLEYTWYSFDDLHEMRKLRNDLEAGVPALSQRPEVQAFTASAQVRATIIRSKLPPIAVYVICTFLPVINFLL